MKKVQDRCDSKLRHYSYVNDEVQTPSSLATSLLEEVSLQTPARPGDEERKKTEVSILPRSPRPLLYPSRDQQRRATGTRTKREVTQDTKVSRGRGAWKTNLDILNV